MDVLTTLMSELSNAKAGQVGIQQTGCAGLCDQEPMMTLTDKAGGMFRYGRLNKNKVGQIVREHVVRGVSGHGIPDQGLSEKGDAAFMNTVRSHVLVCTGGGCIASGALEVSAALREHIERHGLSNEVKVIESGCLGPCAVGPVAAVYPDGVFYQGIRPDDAADIVEEHLLKGASSIGWSTSRPRASRFRGCTRSASSSEAGQDRAAQLRRHRPAADRRIHRP